MRRMSRLAGWLLALALASPLHAETLKVAIGQRGNWDTAVSELGQEAGIFARHDLTLELLYTAGGGETQQAVLSRSVDIGVAVGTLGVMGAASKGAPLRILGGEMTGGADLFWYVPTASPIKAVADLAGHSVAYSTAGSSTDSMVRMLQAQDKVEFRATPTGGLPATFTQVMSGQIDAGWSSAPFGVDALAKGTVRVVFRGSDVVAARDQTIRTLITHAAVLAQKKAAIDRYMQAYRETLDYMYNNPEAITRYAAFAGVSPEVAKRTRDEFFPKAALDPDHLSGLDGVMADGVRFKFLAAPLTAEQLSQTVVMAGFKP